ncbi:MAG: hypothetical protein AVDCRST_MAG30-3148 [uncultured Solirubrobacteraceae bacterium]|uniref:Uncharacterized protein n=1 Tax=uncultured Solirubrobacteraceae bacterium TaxID=1162706 RepID=A0A6J4TGH7_9ACTN|nr:MAG: hypothetical protein AVDCRST_MAG30-3148 [uncultured Solirubrobacteraceae bacterium]
MESPDVSDAGYPEEQPDSVVPDDDDSGKTGSAVEERARPSKEAERAPDNDDGTATGGG